MKDIKIDNDEQQRRLLQEYIFNLEDIQEQAEVLSVAHERLKQSQNMLMSVVGTTTHGICLLRNNTFTWSNEAFLKILGWKQNEVIGKSISLIHPNFAQEAKTGIVFSIYPPIMREHNLVHKDGHSVSCLVTGRLLKADDPSTYVLSIIDFTERKQMEDELRKHRDHLEEMVKERTTELLIANEKLYSEINERKRAEEALKESEEKYRTILHSIEEGYFELDIAGNITFFNDVVRRSSKYQPEELRGMNYRRFCTEETTAKLSPIFQEIRRAEELTKTNDFEVICKDGTTITIEASVTMMFDRTGQPVGLRFVTRDVTKHRKHYKEREKLITELREALANVKILSGLLPICSACKKIRNDEGYWEQIESYISERSDADFTHGICPDCRKKLYPNF
ncbi:MAG: PAS domain-containing protein [Smithellaceae bacterium]